MWQVRSVRRAGFIPGRIKEYAAAFRSGQSDREHMHKVANLPTDEKKEYLRKRAELRDRATGFDWNSVGNSMYYNRQRGHIAWLKHNLGFESGLTNKMEFSKAAHETMPKERVLYTFRDETDLHWWDMMTDENLNGGSRYT